MTKLIYIGGYGHSGSTLLESLMAECPALLACGEVTSCVREGTRKPSRQCSCGREARDCPVWGFFYAADNASRGWTHAELLSALVHGAGSRYAAIVDSSKTAWGSLGAPLRLQRRLGQESALVHLMRDPVAVCWSALKQKDRRAQRQGRRLRYQRLRCTWFVVGWWLANLACDLFGLVYPRHYLRLRYEDLVRAPEDELRKLLWRLLPDMDWASDVAVADNRHQLHGNKVRLRRLTVADVHEDLKWRHEMPPAYARIVLVLTWPLRWRYGYAAWPATGLHRPRSTA